MPLLLQETLGLQQEQAIKVAYADRDNRIILKFAWGTFGRSCEIPVLKTERGNVTNTPSGSCRVRQNAGTHRTNVCASLDRAKVAGVHRNQCRRSLQFSSPTRRHVTTVPHVCQRCWPSPPIRCFRVQRTNVVGSW